MQPTLNLQATEAFPEGSASESILSGHPRSKHHCCPPSMVSELNSKLIFSESEHSFTADFHSRLDALLKTLVQARPHFIRCIKVSDLFSSFAQFLGQICLLAVKLRVQARSV